MSLAPGPIEPFDPSLFPLLVEPPEFEALWRAHDQSFAGADLALTAVGVAVGTGAGDDWRTALQQPLDDAAIAVGEESAPGAQQSVAEEVSAAVDFGESVDAGVGEVPPETWQKIPPPQPPLRPPETQGEPDYWGGYDPGYEQPRPGYNEPWMGGPEVRLANLTRYSYTDFWIGDEFRLEVFGPPYADVRVSGSHDGQEYGPTYYGQTDQYGRFEVTGVMDQSSLGEWYEVWDVGDVGPLAPLALSVWP